MALQSIDKQLAMLPREVKFCKWCVVSNQRPRIVFDEEGVCSACRYAEWKKKHIRWQEREEQLKRLLDKHRRGNGEFDVVVPCSGGKDSSYIAHQLKERWGMTPLTVTWSPFIHTDIGWQNYQRFCRSGFANLLASHNGILHRALARAAFEALGDAWQPFTYGQMCYAFDVAVRFNIKLVFFGENGEAEYGGATWNNEKPGMPLEDWSLLYFKGATVDDLAKWSLEKGYLNDRDFKHSSLLWYRPPSVERLKQAGVQMHWYAYYKKWVPQENYYYSSENTGFRANLKGRSEGTYSKYASLDDRLDGFHYYLAFIKFGIGRATSDAAHEIRDGHLTREDGVALVRSFDGELPKLYFKDFLEYLQITEEEFWKVVDSYRLPHIWKKEGGEWKLRHQVA